MPPHCHTTLESDDSDDEQHSVQTTAPSSTRRTASSKTETSTGTGSDKENMARCRREEDDEGDGEDEDEDGEEEIMIKKEKGKGKATQALHEKVIAEEGDKQFYDPDQKPEERRIVRKGLRELGRSLNDNKAEYLLPNSTGLLTTLTKANQLFKSVKQTSDATLDSRILVDAADMAYNRAKALSLGASAATGIDIDEFVGKLITYMRNSPDVGQRRAGDDDEQHGGGDEGDMLDWAYLGRTATFKGNKRPATSDFLLGPLSVQKRQRIIKSRASGLKRNAANIVRPQELKPSDIQNQESNSTTKLVMEIADTLDEYLTEHDLTEEGQGVNYFRFVINPKSFLVRDGRAALWEGDDGWPWLGLAEAASAEEARERGVVKRQVICTVDMWMWRELVGVLGLEESIIPFREAKEEVGTGGWYS
ncbi:hypothetical protein BGX38DRAFT_1304188 [Terfezia claveryi]|nr:hypothetical protein BGX38DRAFT_1304188 [Terfezia claveryi]